VPLSVEPNPHITFGVAHEDDDLVVVEKPPRLATQPGKGHARDTLLNGLFARFGPQLQNLGKARDFGLLHRLDKETSGLLVVALKPAAYDKLREDFSQRRVRKFYWAVCASAPRPADGVIKLPIVEDFASDDNRAGKPRLAHVSKAGKPAITAYRTLDSSDHAALVEARPITGRLHQVRLHLEAIGCPILGDSFYGPRRVQSASPRLALHAHRLTFTHPTTGAAIDVHTDWPGDLRRVLKNMGLKRPMATAADTLQEIDPPPGLRDSA
jgi:23S rRNA pseudouridine1911/1915/1917 synthase